MQKVRRHKDSQRSGMKYDGNSLSSMKAHKYITPFGISVNGKK